MGTAAVLALKIIGCAILCYFLGSFNASYILGKTFKQKDVRDYGSHNPGSTNAIRAFGFNTFSAQSFSSVTGIVHVLTFSRLGWKIVMDTCLMSYKAS